MANIEDSINDREFFGDFDRKKFPELSMEQVQLKPVVGVQLKKVRPVFVIKQRKPAGDPSIMYKKWSKPEDFIPKQDESKTWNFLEGLIFNKKQKGNPYKLEASNMCSCEY